MLFPLGASSWVTRVLSWASIISPCDEHSHEATVPPSNSGVTTFPSVTSVPDPPNGSGDVPGGVMIPLPPPSSVAMVKNSASSIFIGRGPGLF